MKNTLTQQQLKSILNYDKNIGIFTWIKARGRVRAGDAAGGEHSGGYLHISISIFLYQNYIFHIV